MGWALAPVRLILYTTNELLQFVGKFLCSEYRLAWCTFPLFS